MIGVRERLPANKEMTMNGVQYWVNGSNITATLRGRTCEGRTAQEATELLGKALHMHLVCELPEVEEPAPVVAPEAERGLTEEQAAELTAYMRGAGPSYGPGNDAHMGPVAHKEEGFCECEQCSFYRGMGFKRGMREEF